MAWAIRTSGRNAAQMNPQHHTQWIRLAAVSGLGITWPHDRLRLTPRNYPRHLSRENLSARYLALLAKFIGLGEAFARTGPR